MKKLTTKLLMSFIAVAFAIVALGTSTFAWFTLGGTTTAGAFNANVQTADGIEISLDGTNYKNTISSEEMEAKLVSLIKTANSLTDASIDTLAETGFKFKDNTSKTGATIIAMDGNAVTANTIAGGYLQFTLYFRTTKASGDIYLGSLTEITSTGANWKPDAITVANRVIYKKATGTFSGTETYFTNNNGTYTAVVSPSEDDFDTYYVVDTTCTNPAWTSDTAAETWYAANASRVSFVQDETVKTVLAQENEYGKGGASINGIARAYADVKNFAVPTEATLPTTVTTLYDDTEEKHTLTTICTCGNTATTIGGIDYYTGQVDVIIWLEGWDNDCINAILNDDLTIGFTFRG